MSIYTQLKVATIYRATNTINGKTYIGFDSNWPSRQKDHKYSLKHKSNFKFGRALKKYGWDNFTWDVLYQSTDIEHTLTVMENHFILENDSYHNGYNMTFGGQGTFGLTISDEHRRKVSLADVFVERAAARHDNKYDYTKVQYKNQYTEIDIICPTHGIFSQLPKTHLMGHGCKYCSGNMTDINHFIERSKNKHGDKFSYEKVEYHDSLSPVKNIKCRLHGTFTASMPHRHYDSNNGGCPQCNELVMKTVNSLTHEDFIQKSKANHGDKYDYSKSVYTKAVEKIIIICKIHGEFSQRADWHKNGGGCPKCSLLTKWGKHSPHL